MRALLVLALFAAHAAQAATLNKCVDAKAQVTYTNLPCPQAQSAQRIALDPAPIPDPPRLVSWPPPSTEAPAEAATLPVPVPDGPVAAPALPGPVSEPPLVPPVPGPPALAITDSAVQGPFVAASTSPTEPGVPALLRPATSTVLSPRPRKRASERPCDQLAQQLGALFDRMDATRDTAPPADLATWQQQVHTLETRKQAAGCF